MEDKTQSAGDYIGEILNLLSELPTADQRGVIMEVIHSLKNTKQEHIHKMEEEINILKKELEEFVKIKID